MGLSGFVICHRNQLATSGMCREESAKKLLLVRTFSAPADSNVIAVLAKRLRKAASLSGKDIGNITATETGPKMIPPMTPDITFDIRLSI